MVWTKLLLVFIGGGLGSICRYGINILIHKPAHAVPFGTLVANVISSFLIGFFVAYFMRHANDSMRLLLITGYCGGFSTFSTFSLENIQLMQEGKWLELGLYISASVIVCIISVFAGMKAGGV